jgi:hypothetical protein
VQCNLPTLNSLTWRSSRRVGVRAAIHQVLKKEGVDPVPLDPWYFPTVAQYTSVSGLRIYYYTTTVIST